MTVNAASMARHVFRLYLIKPSHYDDDGYVIQWLRSDIPSNTMATLNGIALECSAARVLGEAVDIVITTLDEANHRIKPNKIIGEIEASGGRGLVALVGVQTNQFPRAVDIARPLRAADVPVCIGGFHVSGCLSMLPRIPPEIQQALDLGISIFAGEAEGQFDKLLRDAYRRQLKPIYNVMADHPRLQGATLPVLPQSDLEGRLSGRASFDSGRGCPYDCSFCTIINVQGRKSRYRTADDVEKVLRDHYALGIKKFFITDDNFARNKNWEAIFDRIIELRQEEGMKLSFIIQVDTMCHKIPNFVEKAGLAGVNRVFIGLESVNPDNLIAVKKNRFTEYRTTLQAWKNIGVITSCGYIIGFPNDTYERVMRDIEIIKSELPVDLISFSCLLRRRARHHRASTDVGRGISSDIPTGMGGFLHARSRGDDHTAGCCLRNQSAQGHETRSVFLRYAEDRGHPSLAGRTVQAEVPEGPAPWFSHRESYGLLSAVSLGDYHKIGSSLHPPPALQAHFGPSRGYPGKAHLHGRRLDPGDEVESTHLEDLQPCYLSMFILD